MDVFWAAFGGGAAAGGVGVLGVLIVEWVRATREGPKLEVKATFARILGAGVDDDQLYFAIDVSNPRMIPMRVNSYGLDRGKHGWLLMPMELAEPRLPHEVSPGSSAGYRVPVDTVMQALMKNGLRVSDIKGVLVNTAIGRVFKGKIPKETRQRLEKLLVDAGEPQGG